jgi:hypothetical protein
MYVCMYVCTVWIRKDFPWRLKKDYCFSPLDSKFSSSIEIITSIIIIIIIAVFVFVCADLLAMLPPLDLRTLQ